MTPKSTLTHPLEAVFNMGDDEMELDIDAEYGMTEVNNNLPAEITPVDHKDEDDILIEKRIDEVYDAAMITFNNQTAFTEIVEPRFAARNAEVAANYLNIALAAANSRAKVKTDRKRSNQTFVPYANGGKTTNNLIIADRNEILKMITIDADKKEF